VIAWLLSLSAAAQQVRDREIHVASPADLAGPWTNRLIDASSSYLLEHAHDPVDWRPWGEGAFEEAKRRDVPLFVSIGYASCHWCRVMKEESFEDPETAALLNEHFVAVKVDRGERPDIDALYAQALRELIGRSGWPASLFVTPDGAPFSGGTYLPREPTDTRSSFRQAMEAATLAWSGDRSAVLAEAERLGRELRDQARRASGTATPPEETVQRAIADLAASEDPLHGGWGDAKFPQAPVLELLLDRVALGDTEAVRPLVHTLDAIALGALHDPLGGGFHRLAVDRAWREPHFEKTLYDNAQLASVYLDAGRVLGAARHRELGRETLDWMLANLWSEEQNAFVAGLSADSEGRDGAYYVWTRPALVGALGRTDGLRAAERFRVDSRRPAALSLVTPLQPAELSLRDALAAARAQRPAPSLDGLAVVGWNGLALTSLARGILVEGEGRLLHIARRLAAALLAARHADGTLPRTLALGGSSGILDDHALVAEGLLDLYEVDPDPRWLLGARALGMVLQARFAEPDGGYWYTLGDGDEAEDATLLARQMMWLDGGEPSGLGRAVRVIQRLAAFGAPGIDEAQAERTLARASRYLQGRGAGQGFPSLVRALSWRYDGGWRLVVVGDPEAPEVQRLAAVYSATRRPGMVLGVVEPDVLPSGWSLLAGEIEGAYGAQAFLCGRGECSAPTADATELAVQVASALGVSPIRP
jgi:uncharacterized protein YyaL (SSP411 family)